MNKNDMNNLNDILNDNSISEDLKLEKLRINSDVFLPYSKNYKSLPKNSTLCKECIKRNTARVKRSYSECNYYDITPIIPITPLHIIVSFIAGTASGIILTIFGIIIIYEK